MSPLRFIYNHNPFYVLSAAFVLFGLDQFFRSEDPITYIGSLAVYIFILSMSAWAIIKWGKVWEDARTLLLLVVLLLLALSTGLDQKLLQDFSQGAPIVVGMWFFSVFIIEGLIRATRIVLPFVYRFSLHWTLAAFFFFPVLLSLKIQTTTSANSLELQLWVSFFSTLVSIGFLPLLFCFKNGQRDFQRNGTPWQWPAYPLPLWVILVFAGLGRAYYLTVSFNPSIGNDSFFHPFLLVPMVGVTSLLLGELAYQEKSRVFQNLSLGLSLSLPLLAFPVWVQGSNSGIFYEDFTEVAFHPLLGAIIQVLFLALYHEWRRESFGSALAVCSWLFLAFFNFESSQFQIQPNSVPLIALSVHNLIRLIWQRNSMHFFWTLAGCFPLAAIWLLSSRSLFELLLIQVHLVLYCALIAGLIFRDPSSSFFRWIGITGLLLISSGALFEAFFLSEVTLSLLVYLVIVWAGFVLSYWICRERWLEVLLKSIGIGLALFVVIRGGYLLYQLYWRKGLGVLLGGFFFLIVAWWISYMKSKQADDPQELK